MSHYTSSKNDKAVFILDQKHHLAVCKSLHVQTALTAKLVGTSLNWNLEIMIDHD